MQASLLTIFFISGISALIYQVSWQRLLTVYYGVGAVSITLIVSIYLLGLGMGALLGGRLAEMRKDLVSLYFCTELGIGIFGIASFPFLLTVGRLTAGSPYLLAVCYETIFLLIPTILMGMSLPLLVKIFDRVMPDLYRSVSRLYCVNTLGGAAGTLLGSYYLISFYGIKVAIAVAATINLFLALGVFVMSRLISIRDLDREAPLQTSFVGGKIVRYAPVVVFITGVLAIGYELIWFRIIGVLVKSSPYAFASVLAVYLLGIALGSYSIGKIISGFSSEKRIKLFLTLQVMVALSVAVIFMGYYYLTLGSPFQYWTKLSFGQPVHPPLYMLTTPFHAQNMTEAIVYTFRVGTVLIWPVFFLLVPTMLMGASFPLIIGIVSERSAGVAWVTGKIYFFNILGNVLGGVLTGFFLLPVLGSELTILIFILIGLMFALSAFSGKRSCKHDIGLVFIALAIVLFFPKKGEIYRVIHPKLEGFKQYFREGRDGVVMTYVNGVGAVHNYINGDPHGGRPAYSFYVQVLEAVAVANSVENALIIGYGTGSVAEGVLRIPGVKKVTVVELNQTLLNNLRRIPLFQELMNDHRLEIVVDDGRRFLQSRKDLYDLVFMSPLRSMTAYSNNLYSQQFFELVSAHLAGSGVLSVWTDSLDTTFRTIDQVFPYKRFHVGYMEGFYLTSNQPIAVVKDADALRPFMNSFDPVTQSRIIDASRGFAVVSQEAVRAKAYHYLPSQDWTPLSEYYLGIWFSDYWMRANRGSVRMQD